MLFNSYFFILFFLPVSLFLYYQFNRLDKPKIAKLALFLMSLWFYAFFHFAYLFLILGSIILNYFFSKLASPSCQVGFSKKIILGLGITANIGIIFYFKYFNFFIENVNFIFGSSFSLFNILMPLGISFFTFQQISYLVDSYHGETSSYSILDYALFVAFFPQLVAGPIVLHKEMIPQFNDPAKRKISYEKTARGIYLFSTGLFKKVMLADTLGNGVNWGFSNITSLSGPDALLTVLMYTLQIYFDFSGYCDMASGIANLFQFDLPQNFNSPYKANSILDFWKRWHMSLTGFLRKYIYFPLGGSKKGRIRTVINTIIVFLISGLWHGANWTFIVWGLLHGIASVCNRIFKNRWSKFPSFFRWILTFSFINLTWIFFRSDTLADAFALLTRLFMEWPGPINPQLLHCFDLLEFTYLEDHISALATIINYFPAMHMTLILSGCMLITLAFKNSNEKIFKPTRFNAAGCIILLIWSIVSLSGLSTFLYFNF